MLNYNERIWQDLLAAVIIISLSVLNTFAGYVLSTRMRHVSFVLLPLSHTNTHTKKKKRSKLKGFSLARETAQQVTIHKHHKITR